MILDGPNLSVTGTVNSRDMATDGANLDTINGYFTNNTYSAIGAASETGDSTKDFAANTLTAENMGRFGAQYGSTAGALVDSIDAATCVFGHFVNSTSGSIDGSAIAVEAAGDTYLNAITGSILRLCIDGNTKAWVAADGDFHATNDIIAYASSDSRLKDNQKNIENPLEKISELNGIEFDWNDKQSSYEGRDIGLLAQEVEKIIPSAVQTRESGYKAVKYEKVIPVLVEAVKELAKVSHEKIEYQSQIDELKAEIKALKESK
jgi:hypothetical protein